MELFEAVLGFSLISLFLHVVPSRWEKLCMLNITANIIVLDINESFILRFIGINEVSTIFFVQEYNSFAHCVGGGCASVATSFIFTPSERIKQQMQVRSHYRNCWYASFF